MKKCGYCAKEISYNEMYCSDDCEKSCQKYYNSRVKLQVLLSICNILGTVSIFIGVFVYALLNWLGLGLVAIGGFIVGSITLLLPTPTDNIIEKYKLKKAIKIVRIFGLVLLCMGLGALIYLLIII